MARWTSEGEELLDSLAENASLYTHSIQSAVNIYNEVELACKFVLNSRPGSWQKITNLFKQDRYWHPTSSGKVVIWKIDTDNHPTFVGVYRALPNPLSV